MNEIYNEFVASKLKTGTDILMSMDGRKANLMHLMMGLSGEVGELTDCIKKHIAYDQPLDYDNLVEELGDIEFFLQGIRNAFSLKRNDIITNNMDKLNQRYQEGYTDEEARNRADK